MFIPTNKMLSKLGARFALFSHLHSELTHQMPTLNLLQRHTHIISPQTWPSYLTLRALTEYSEELVLTSQMDQQLTMELPPKGPSLNTRRYMGQDTREC